MNRRTLLKTAVSAAGLVFVPEVAWSAPSSHRRLTTIGFAYALSSDMYERVGEMADMLKYAAVQHAKEAYDKQGWYVPPVGEPLLWSPRMEREKFSQANLVIYIKAPGSYGTIDPCIQSATVGVKMYARPARLYEFFDPSTIRESFAHAWAQHWRARV